MKKKLAIFLLAFALPFGSVTPAIHGVASETSETESYVTEKIGNLTYEVPSRWSKTDISSSDTDSTTYQFQGDYSTMLVLFLPVEDFELYTTDMQKMLVDSVLGSFESQDNYHEDKNENTTFHGNYANVRSFTYGDSYSAIAYSVGTGDGIACFVFAFNLAKSTDITKADIEAFTNVSSSIEISDTSSESQTYSSGMYKVGTDIPSGEYVVFAKSGTGYFCVSSDSNQNDITFNDNFEYNSIITVEDGEYLDLSRCYAVPLSDDPDVELGGSGMFLVGTHIPAGEYKIDSGNEYGYYCIYSSSRQDHIIANDNFTGTTYVTVDNGQYLEFSRCHFVDIPAKPQKVYTDSDTIKKVQESLNSAGYDCGTPDGICGPSTMSSIQKYRSDHSLPESNDITDDLLGSLNIK